MGNNSKPNLGRNQYCLNLDDEWQRQGLRNQSPSSVLFFVIKPPQSMASELYESTRRHCEKHRTGCWPHPAHLLHVSVLPLWIGDKPPARIINWAAAAAEMLHVQPIDFTFDRTQLLGNKKHVGLVERGTNYNFNQFNQTLLKSLGLSCHRLACSAPHVTLIYDRKETPIMPLERPVIWTASEFMLVCSWWGQSRHEEFGRWCFNLEAPAYPKRLEKLQLSLLDDAIRAKNSSHDYCRTPEA